MITDRFHYTGRTNTFLGETLARDLSSLSNPPPTSPSSLPTLTSLPGNHYRQPPPPLTNQQNAGPQDHTGASDHH